MNLVAQMGQAKLLEQTKKVCEVGSYATEGIEDATVGEQLADDAGGGQNVDVLEELHYESPLRMKSLR